MKVRKRLIGIMLSAIMMTATIPSFGAELPFRDVSESAWYYNDVKNAYESGLINGMDDRSFSPDSNLTYAQAVKLAACMNQKYLTGSVSLENGSPYWYSSYVAYAKANNIIDKDYNWDASATRAGYVEIFANALPDDALKVINTVDENAIPDVAQNHPLAAAIYKLYRAGILTGIDKTGLFLPFSKIKRSEVSAILTRMMNEKERKIITLGPVTKTFTVSFETDGGNTVEAQIVTEKGIVLEPEVPTKDGYDFDGWYTDRQLTVKYDFAEPVEDDVTLYARWKKNIPFWQ